LNFYYLRIAICEITIIATIKAIRAIKKIARGSIDLNPSFVEDFIFTELLLMYMTT